MNLSAAVRYLLVALLVGVDSGPWADGQVSFFQPPAFPCGGVLSGDFNGDGKADVICGNGNVELGNGDGTFKTGTLLGVAGVPVAAADFNGDGKLDLLVFNNGTTFSILLGKGDGTFTTSATVNPGLSFQTMAAGDFRANGKVDIVGLAPGTGVFVFLGNGDGTVQPYVIYDSGLASVGGMVAGDYNGDGKLDIAVGGSGSNAVAVLLGNGDGTFQAPLNSTGMPSLLFAAAAFTSSHILDLVVMPNPNAGNTSVLLGNGDGTFQTAQSVSPMTPSGVGVADLNGDGKLDLVLSGSLVAQTYLGNGDGTFRLADTYNELGAQNSSGGGSTVLVADFNGDGKLDAISGGTIFFGNGDGSLQGSPEVLNPDSLEFEGTAVGDFNSDGKPDIASLSDNRAKNLYILLNQGGSQFSVAHTYTLSVNGGDPAGPILVGDLNNDGKLDLVVITVDPISQYWTLNILLGNGDGSFTGPTAYPQGVPQPLSPVLADFKGNHNLDLALVESSMVIYYGNGDGTFQAPVNYFAGAEPVAVAAADFNNDGKTDVAVFSQAGLGILLGNGDGTFQNPTYLSTGVNPVPGTLLFAADLNDDGNIDLMVGNQVFLGHGDGTFTTLPPGNVQPQLLADVNGDGSLDAMSGGSIYLGNGNGTFGNPITLMTWYKFCCSGGISAAADFNGHSLPDLAVNTQSNGAGGIIFLLNNTAPGFGISASALTPATVTAGGSASSTVTLAPVAGFNGTVSLTCAGLPSGAGCVFNPPSVPGGSGTSQLTITTSSATGGGTYPIKVTGTSNSLVQSTVISFVVQAGPDFAIGPASGSQDSQSIGAGQAATFDLAVTPAGSFSGTVDLTCSISPVATAGPTCSLPSSVQVAAGKAAPVTVTVATTAPVTAGTISELSVPPGAFRFAWTVLLFVAGFLLMPKRLRLPVRAAPMIVLTLGLLAGCGGGGSSSHNFPGTPSGTYTVTVKATSGSLNHTTTLTVVVQ